MAFNQSNMNFIDGSLQLQGVNNFTYFSDTDTLATITASGYFVPGETQYDSGASSNLQDFVGSFKVGNFLFIEASDQSAIAVITALDPVTTQVITDYSFISYVIAEGVFTWSGSGATKAVSVPGTLTTDRVFTGIENAPTQAAYVSVASITVNGTLTVGLSAANTSNNAVIAYTVRRTIA